MAAASIAGRGFGRAAAAGAAASRAAGSAARHRLETLFNTGGIGFRDLAVTHVSSTFGDTMVALSLAGTLFFSVPSSQARGNVALYLLLTIAPFAVIGPLLGWLLDTRPAATRGALILSALARAAFALAMIWMLDGLWLFPAAFGLLVASRVHGIARNALLPIALGAPGALVAANGRLATISVIGGTVAAPVGGLAIWLLDARAALVVATLAFLVAALSGRLVPRIDTDADGGAAASKIRRRFRLPRTVRLAQLATAVVRVLNGFLLLLLAFAFKDLGGGILDLGAVLAAGGAGFFVASLTSPALERRLREEPMVVAGLAVEAAAAFIAGQWFGLPAAAFLAASAGFAWGTAKLAFDGLLQSAVPEGARGSAFTRSETLFQLAWVAGAVVPTALPLPTTIGLVLAGLTALTAQVVYVSHLLTPLRTVSS
jgi:hypothetical protein